MASARRLLVAVLLVSSSSVAAVAQPAGHAEDHHHAEGPTHEPANAAGHALHAHPGASIAHPIVSESPLPESHIRLDYVFADAGDAKEHVAAATVEYAFVPEFSVELSVPYVWLDPKDGDRADHFGDSEVAFKYATYRWTDQHLLPAVGLAVAVPTGDEERDIGSDHVWELEPFARVGIWHGDFEFIAGVALAIPLNRAGDEKEEDDFGVHYNLSTLYHVMPSLQALIELHGESVWGDADDTHALYVSPGLTAQPFEEKSITIGAGVSLPLTDDREFDFAVNVVGFVHF